MSHVGKSAVPEVFREQEPLRLVIRRVPLRPLLRVGLTLGWLVSLVPATLLSILLVWLLHELWGMLNSWAPWTPWPPETRVVGFTLPTPEFRPREVLQAERLYRVLTPLGRHPVLSVVVGALVLTIVGSLVGAGMLLTGGLAYNRYAFLLGGVEVEVVRRPMRGGERGREDAATDVPEEWRDAPLRWR